MKRNNWILALAAGLTSIGVQAGITKAPDMPAHAILDWPVSDPALGDNLGGPPVTFTYELTPLGNARADALRWVADVTEVSGDLIRLGGDDTGLTVIHSTPLGSFTSTWKDLTIDLAQGIVTGDEFVNGSRVSNDARMASLFNGGLSMEGTTTVLMGLGVGTLRLVSAVPEASSGLSMALGLMGLTWALRRRACLQS